MKLIGLTGGIASGKTFVSDCFAALGVHIIDADLLAREVVAPGSDGLKALVEHFSTSILKTPDLQTNNTPPANGLAPEDAALDRAALRNIIFANPEQRKILDDTLHPRIRALSEQRIAEARQRELDYVIYAVPLLVETTQQSRFDRIVVVDVPEAVQLARLTQRDGSSQAQAQSILDAQATREERLAIADDVIDNSGTQESTRKRVEELHRFYSALT